MIFLVSGEKTILTCNEYNSEIEVNEEQIHSDKCTFSYVEIDELNEIQISPVLIKDVDYESNVNEIDASSSITSVHFVNSRLSRLPNEIFIKFMNLKTLNCDGINLQTLKRDDIEAAESLQDLSCNSNYIKTLESNLFNNSRKLRNLDLSINDIEVIVETAFNALTEMRKLFLYDNQLSTLPNEVFKDLINLEEISLSHNQIQIIAEQLFSTCKHLKYIYLNDNHLIQLNGAAFSAIESIAFLEISNNRLRELKLNISASALYANNNQLQSIDLMSIGYLSFYNNSISQVTFHNLSDILSLNLSTNNLIIESLQDIIQLSEVKSLDLSFNTLGSLNVSTFLALNGLQVLNLQSTNLSTIDYGLFVHQTKLEQLDISYNNLRTLDINKLATLRSLTALFIEGNHLIEFNYDEIKIALPKLTTFGYTDNSWKCSYLTKMNAFMESNGIEIFHLVTVKTRSNVAGIACSIDDDDERSNEDKLFPTNSIRHKMSAAVTAHDNELSVILEKFESILHHHDLNKSNRDSAASQTELIEELSKMKSRIAFFEEQLNIIMKRTENITAIDEILKAMQNSSELSAIREKVYNIEKVLVNLNTLNLNENSGEIYHSSSSSFTNSADDFITKAMISIIFVIVCGFIIIYIIKLYARKYKCKDFRTYNYGDTIDENIL
ncbi:hypothetical protein PVAND_007097 [Polypedilum vanderplanki]|uniref:Uncharacterized protein n=1 Tax=Polypedilum vanderplanki TaxID=319348 RepID=A0A9J6C5C5_POLVA|nr:hypothetical protein PVAND_007097 [Polypedilum vanderplanki]